MPTEIETSRPTTIDHGNSNDTAPGTIATIPAGAKMHERFSFPETMPAWWTEQDLDFYAGEFARAGFRGHPPPR